MRTWEWPIFFVCLAATGSASAMPPVPMPSGPVSGTFDCLLHRASTDTASTIFVTEGSDPKVLFQGSFPTSISEGDKFQLSEGQRMALVGIDGQDKMRLTRLIPGRSGSWWQLSARASDGYFWDAGICVGEIQQGRVERPIVLESIRAVRVETVGIDE